MHAESNNEETTGADRCAKRRGERPGEMGSGAGRADHAAAAGRGVGGGDINEGFADQERGVLRGSEDDQAGNLGGVTESAAAGKVTGLAAGPLRAVRARIIARLLRLGRVGVLSISDLLRRLPRRTMLAMRLACVFFRTWFRSGRRRAFGADGRGLAQPHARVSARGDIREQRQQGDQT